MFITGQASDQQKPAWSDPVKLDERGMFSI